MTLLFVVVPPGVVRHHGRRGRSLAEHNSMKTEAGLPIPGIITDKKVKGHDSRIDFHNLRRRKIRKRILN